MEIMISQRVKIQHEKFGELLNETFIDPIQFKLFLKMLQGCLELKNDLTFFNGVNFLIHIPINHLLTSIITTHQVEDYKLTDHFKSKIEALVTK